MRITARTKTKYLATIALAALAMAAAPASDEAAPRASSWSRIVGGAKGFVQNPFGLLRRAARERGPETNLSPEITGPRRDPLVRQATARAAKSPAKAPAAARPPEASRAIWFSRPQRESRTVFQYMAEEKP